MFQLEAIFAKHGDCLLLHYGPAEDRKWLLIDGGARGVYGDFLKPRLEQLAAGAGLGRPVPLEMVMVSHVDSDHIAGVLDLFRHLKDPRQDPKICSVGQLWHNSFDDIIDNDDKELVSTLIAEPPGGQAEPPDEDTGAVIASVNQGRNLREDAKTLAMTTNQAFGGRLIRALGGPAQPIQQGHGLTFKVLAPSEARLRAYQQKWDEFLQDKGLAEVEAAGFNDKSAFNLASIVVLAEKGGKSMLLTGDARGDYTVNGLVDAGLMDEEARYPIREDFPDDRDGSREWRAASNAADAKAVAPFKVDLLKAPHHGSANNVTPGFFRRVLADHYVFSGNGNHHNPDPETLQMLADARGDEPYTMHFTFTADQHETEPNPEFAENLKTVHDWIQANKPPNCTIVHRQPGDDIFSIAVELEGD